MAVTHTTVWQATNELQLLGVVKAAPRKRRGNHAQRLVWAA